MRNAVAVAVAAAAILLTGSAVANDSGTGTPLTAATRPTPLAVDQRPQGPSLFDRLFATVQDGKRIYDIPYPFAALRRALANRFGGGSEPRFHEVLIPIGRALQRNAAAPDYFGSPRIVMAVGQLPLDPVEVFQPMLRDRLFIGYQEKAESLEVISYSVEAGRFAFQVVKDYAAGQTPRVTAANRALCTSCHQNGGPIFAEPLWRETNANPNVARRLRTTQGDFNGVAVLTGRRALDAAFEVGNSVHRANLLPVYQQLWQNACSSPQQSDEAIDCRAAILTLALQKLLSNQRHFDRTSTSYRRTVSGTFARGWARQWPHGLAIPNPLIPDLDPTITKDTSARADPLTPRPPLEIWRTSSDEDLERVVDGVAQLFSRADAKILDSHLAALTRDKPAPRPLLKTPCAFSTRPFSDGRTRITFRCRRSEESRFHLDGEIFLRGDVPENGRIHTLHLAEGEHFDALRVTTDPSERSNSEDNIRLRLLEADGMRRPRLANGNVLVGLQLRWTRLWKENFGPSAELPYYPISGEAILRTVADFPHVRSAIAGMAADTRAHKTDALSDKPFRRAAVLKALFARLDVPHKRQVTSPALTDLTRLRVEHARRETAHHPKPADGMLAGFHRHCGSCHSTPDRFPPNFLLGDPALQKSSIARCAERIAHRLAIWDVPAAERSRSPMPPIGHLLRAGWTLESWRSSNALADLRRYSQSLVAGLPARRDRAALGGGKMYDNLPACLAPANQSETSK